MIAGEVLCPAKTYLEEKIIKQSFTDIDDCHCCTVVLLDCSGLVPVLLRESQSRGQLIKAFVSCNAIQSFNRQKVLMQLGMGVEHGGSWHTKSAIDLA